MYAKVDMAAGTCLAEKLMGGSFNESESNGLSYSRILKY
jgi:hypothetical protein